MRVVDFLESSRNEGSEQDADPFGDDVSRLVGSTLDEWDIKQRKPFLSGTAFADSHNGPAQIFEQAAFSRVAVELFFVPVPAVVLDDDAQFGCDKVDGYRAAVHATWSVVVVDLK